MAFVGALRSAGGMQLSFFCGNGEGTHWDGGELQEAEEIGNEACILKPEGFSGASWSPGPLWALRFAVGGWPSRGLQGLAFWISRTP